MVNYLGFNIKCYLGRSCVRGLIICSQDVELPGCQRIFRQGPEEHQESSEMLTNLLYFTLPILAYLSNQIVKHLNIHNKDCTCSWQNSVILQSYIMLNNGSAEQTIRF